MLLPYEKKNKQNKKQKMLTLKIDDESGERSLCVRGENMKDLIDVELPKWLPIYKDDQKLLKNNKDYILDPKGFQKKEKESGWYYDL